MNRGFSTFGFPPRPKGHTLSSNLGLDAPSARQRGNYDQSADRFPTGRRCLPLPGGEGRGEGERKHYSVQGFKARLKGRGILSPMKRERVNIIQFKGRH